MNMGTTARDTQIVADHEVPLVWITREFDAPAERVFRAHVDPALIVQWVGQPGPGHRGRRDARR